MKRKTYKRKNKKNYKGGGNYKFYLIHGPNEERKKVMLEQFSKFGIDNNNVRWMTGLNRDSLSQEFIDVICTNKDLTSANISVVLNHYMALRDIVKNNYPLSVIMEDDIRFKENVPERLNKCLEQLPDDWDVLFESDYLDYTDGPIDSNKLVYKKEINGTRTTCFYLITLKAAKKLCEEVNFLPFNKVYDFYLNDIFNKYKFNCYWTQPSNVEFIKELPSTVNK